MLLSTLRPRLNFEQVLSHIPSIRNHLLATYTGQQEAYQTLNSSDIVLPRRSRLRLSHGRHLFQSSESRHEEHLKMGSLKNQLPTLTLDEDLIETCKANAARLAVDDNINSDCVIGIGSGSTMRYVLERIKQRCQDQNFHVKCIPTSFQAKQLIHDYGMPLGELDTNPVIDVTIDGADEIDENFVAIKGGGACLAQEKVIAYAANKFVVVADYRKDSAHLGDNWKKGIPIEVLPMACQAVRHHVARRFDADLEDLRVRIGREKAGPVITDNGNFVIDWRFNRKEHHKFTASAWANLSNQLKAIPGVVETGIFANMIKAAYFGCTDGTVLKKIPESDNDQEESGKNE